MRTVSNYAAVLQMPDRGAPMLKALAGAINFDLALPQTCIDVMGPRISEIGKTVKVFAANDPRLPLVDQIKGFLAQKWAVPADNPILSDVSNKVESFFHTNMPELDLGWMNLFDLVDLRNSNQSSFDIIDTNAGLSFQQLKPGAAIKVRREITEATTPVPYLTYGDGIGLLDDWLRFQKFWNVEQAVAEFRAKAWDKMAELHYGLLTALGAGVNTAFATNDTQTFNNAASTILRAVRAKGYATGQNARFWIVCAPEKLGRILAMLEATQGSAIVANQAGMQPLAYSVAGVIATTWVPSADAGYYLVLPGRKMKRGLWLDLQIESQRDIYARATDWVGTEQFNAIIGDSDQVRRVLYA